jgi:hypothetical protein
MPKENNYIINEVVFAEDQNALFAVRLFDKGVWSTISSPLPLSAARKIWREETSNGRTKISPKGTIYYDIFTAE